MSLLKVRSPGVLPRVVSIVVLVACIAVSRDESIMSLDWFIFWGGLLYSSVRKTFPTFWYILFQMELYWVFLIVELTYLTLDMDRIHWNLCLMNSPPLSCTHHIGRGYLESQYWKNLDWTCAAVLLSIRINSTKLESISMQVRSLNSTMRPLNLTFHGPIKKITTSSQGAILILCSGKSP